MDAISVLCDVASACGHCSLVGGVHLDEKSTMPTLVINIVTSQELCEHDCQTHSLFSVRIEVIWVHPLHDGLPAYRPLAVRGEVPCRISVISLHNHVLAEQAFKLVSKPYRGFS